MNLRIGIAVLVALVFSGPLVQAQEDPAVVSQLKQLGTGMWMWQLTSCGVPHAVVEKAKRHGIGHVYIKVHEGSRRLPYNTPECINETAQAFTDAGIKVFAWGFTYANHPEAEANLIIEALDNPNIVGYVYDVEGPVERLGKWDNVQEMLQTVRDHQQRCSTCRKKLLGFAPYAYPSRHSRVPYELFVTYTDFIEPQMYWADMGQPVGQHVWRLCEDWLRWEAKNNISRPIIPLGQSYGTVRRGEIREFLERTKGYHAVSFWSWQHATPSMWGEVGEAPGIRGDRVLSPGTPALIVAWMGILRTAWYWRVVSALLAIMLICLSTKERKEYSDGCSAGIIVIAAALWPLTLCLIAIVCLVRLISHIWNTHGRTWYRDQKKRRKK